MVSTSPRGPGQSDIAVFVPLVVFRSFTVTHCDDSNRRQIPGHNKLVVILVTRNENDHEKQTDSICIISFDCTHSHQFTIRGVHLQVANTNTVQRHTILSLFLLRIIVLSPPSRW